MTSAADDLRDLLAAAAAHDKRDRVPVWRDRIAAFGAEAVDAVAPWVGDRDLDLFRFANRVIKSVALTQGAARSHAVRVLEALARADIPDENRRDVEAVLGELGARPAKHAIPSARRGSASRPDVLPAEEREPTVIHGRELAHDGREGIGFTVMAHADGASLGIPIAARAELGLGDDAPVYLEIRRTGRHMPATGEPGELVFVGETAMHSGAEVYRRRDDDSTQGLEKIGANEVVDVIVARPKP